MRSHCSLSSILALLGLGYSTCAQLVDVPSVENFYRRSSASATVIGNYVYIDGGEVSQVSEGVRPGNQGRYSSNPVNSTISIDISKSWTASEAVLRSIERPWTSKANQVIWTDLEDGSFYVWAGKWFGGKNMTTNELWKFTTDGSGGGTWALQPAANAGLFSGLEQAEYAVFANSNTKGFSIGGVASGWTKKYRGSNLAVSGMVAFDMKTKVWQNGTTGFSPITVDTLAAGRAQFIPNLGPNGLIMLLGGVAHKVDAEINWDNARPYDLRNLTFFDPETNQTYWQVATGDVPDSPRSQFCSTGFQNPDGGYEILVMGGYNHNKKILYEDTYILSLPGFVWTRVADSPTGPRRTPSCVSLGRQMLMIGGTAVGGWDEKDPSPQGLTLFDMTDLKWKDSYDANAAAYERPADLKAWYNNGVEWSSDQVRELFGVAAAQTTNTADSRESGQAGESGSSASSNADPSVNTSESESSSSTPVAAIAGGVVGGVVALALIGVAAWLLVRRRRKADEAANGASMSEYTHVQYNADGSDYGKSTVTGTETELTGSKVERLELHTERSHAELGGSFVYMAPEPNAPAAAFEMDATPITPRH